MSAPPNKVDIADLARWLRVEENAQRDRLELASPWQMLPPDAPNRHLVRIGSLLALVLLLMLFMQAALTRSNIAWALAGVALAGLAFVAWRMRAWFWRTVVDVDASQVSISHAGFGAPKGVSLPLDDIRALRYRMYDGHLASLALEHDSGKLALPYSGKHELDKLYCNLLRHLLQKRRPGIGFGQTESTELNH